jgi:hypothetical protein
LQKRREPHTIIFVDMEIMKTFVSRFGALITGGLLFCTSSAVLATDVVLHQVPPLTVKQTSAYPENLARNYLGARLQAIDGRAVPAELKAADAALPPGDPTVGYALPAGTTTLLVALPKIENIACVSFMNEGAKGSVTIATSNARLPMNSPQWHAVASQDLPPSGLQTKLGPSEAKYVRLTFTIGEPGEITGFGVYANSQLSDFTAPRTPKAPYNAPGGFGLVSYNHTDMHTKARALYVSSGDNLQHANKMIDDQAATTYAFAAGDGSPTAVVDLGKLVSLHRLSAVYSPRAGRMEFYVLQSLPAVGTTLPEKTNMASNEGSVPPTMILNDAAFAQLRAVGSSTDDGNKGRASIEFPAVSGRYVMVRWLSVAQQDNPFSVAEIAAFGGGAGNNTLLAANAETSGGSEEVAENDYEIDGKTMVDGKTMTDTKDMPEEGPQEEPPGEGPPPNLPQPPPFTFVPVLVPASP